MLDSLPRNWHARPPRSSLLLFLQLFFSIASSFLLAVFATFQRRTISFATRSKITTLSSFCWTTRIPSEMSLFPTTETWFSWPVPGLFFSLSDGINTRSSRHALRLLFGRFRSSCFFEIFKVMFLVSNNFFFSSITINFYINCSRKLFSNAALKLQCLAWWRRRTRYVSTGSPSFGAICLNTCLERYVFFSTKMVIQFRINITTYVYAAIYIAAAI